MMTAAFLLLGCPSGAAAGDSGVSESLPFLQQGEFRLDCEAGYARYAFPIGDAALARKWTTFRAEENQANWASRGELAYQLAYDYSVIPVHFRIAHRRPEAFAGTVEIESTHGYGVAENPLGHRTLLRHEFLAPPSSPIEFTLSPRVVPPVRPGSSERLIVRIYQRGLTRPIDRRELSVTQLEPSHLYSLVLDDPALPHGQTINKDNYLKLQIPANRSELVLDPSIYSSEHYFLGCPHRAVTGLPLAARQFAFVLADYSNVRTWNVAEQQSLMQFVVAGGRLILFNAGRDAVWQGCSLAQPDAVARGWLIPLAGPRRLAEQTAQRWLEGELEEFALYARGSAHGIRLDPNSFNAFRDSNLLLDEVYASALPDALAIPLSRRPGYLHPLWLYRAATDLGTLEPWDYPEFTQFAGDESDNNLLLRAITAAQPGTTAPLGLSRLLGQQRVLPLWWKVVPFALLGLTAGVMAFPSSGFRKLQLLGIGCALSLATLLWKSVAPLQLPVGSMQLIDCDQRTEIATARTVHAKFATRSGEIALKLNAGSLLRRVDWQPAGNWQLRASTAAVGDSPTHWHGKSGGAFVALRTDVASLKAKVGLSAEVTPTPDGYCVILNTKELPPGQLVILQTSLGWHALKTSETTQRIYLQLSPLPRVPGVDRAMAVQRLSRSWGMQLRSVKSMSNWQSRLLLAQLLEDGWTTELRRQGTQQDALLRLGWSAILQDPLGGRGLPVNQLVFYAVTNTLPENGATAGGPLETTWMRYCIPLQ
jgi:hypothetical protein